MLISPSKLNKISVDISDFSKTISEIEIISKNAEARTKTLKSKLKGHIDKYPLNEYAQDLIKVSNDFEKEKSQTPLEYIIQITMERLQSKLLGKIRKEMRQLTNSCSSEKNAMQTDSNVSRVDKSSSLSNDKKRSQNSKKTPKINLKAKKQNDSRNKFKKHRVHTDPRMIKVLSAAASKSRSRFPNSAAINSEIIEEFPMYQHEDEEYTEGLDTPQNHIPLNEKSQKLKESLWSNDKQPFVNENSASKEFVQHQESELFSTLNMKNNPILKTKFMKTFKPSATMRPDKVEVTDLTINKKHSQQSIKPISKLQNAAQENSKNGIIFSSKQSSNISSEVSRSESFSPKKKMQESIGMPYL